jgi:competence ComEA-like helix-hairpin-helix protein
MAAAIITAVFVSFAMGYFLGRRAVPSGVTTPAAVSVTESTAPASSAPAIARQSPAESSAAETPETPAAPETAASDAHHDEQGRLRINLATQEELQELPGVGPAIAARIYEYIQSNGPLKRAATLKNVSGIGDKRFEAIEPMITVD